MQPSTSRIEMKKDLSMNQQGNVGSPHISRLESDLSKINPIENQSTTWSSDHTMGDSQNTSDAHHSQFANIENEDRSHRPIIESTMIQPLQQSASWSNVVSSSSPIKFTGSTDETIYTSNNSTNRNNLEFRNQKSHSFDANEERSQDLNYLPQSIGFGNQSMTRSRPQNSWGIPLPHPATHGNTPHQLPTINQGMQGPSTPLHSPRMYSTPHHPYDCFSPLSLCDSTDQTTPLSSPSMSPHVAPMLGHRDPPTWQLSPMPTNAMDLDLNDVHSESAQSRIRPAEHLRNFYQNAPQVYGHNRTPQGYIHPRYGSSGPSSPPRQLHASSSTLHQQHTGPSRRTTISSGPVNRSPTEVLKTLLRKKACLYEPETSSAVALVTWLVGRRLAIKHGYFSRQQLQSGVHACVASKIKEGHVTRTKVNRCMQIILNSCFHYIIPRSDGTEESGDLFRQTFLQNAANDEHLLQNLSPPWNKIGLDIYADEGIIDIGEGSDDDASHHSSRNHNKYSSSTSHAGESVDSGKRSVLLCFNENILSAADVFHCHNEFIRDVAHAANLSLSIEDWKMFFSGRKAYKKAIINEACAQMYFNFMDGSSSDGNEGMNQRGLSQFHTTWCAKRYDHDHSLCSFAHIEVNRGWLRRDPFSYKYKPVICPSIIPLQTFGDCFINICPRGINCDHAHSREEIIYHPESYKKNPCSSAANACPMRDICPNTHASKGHDGFTDAPSQGYNRHGKRNHTGPKKNCPTGHGQQSAGFTKSPNGSPMLYIDPAPVSELEKSLLLPGLQALFRDFSNSIFNSLYKDNKREYGLFGYKSVPQVRRKTVPLGSIGEGKAV